MDFIEEAKKLGFSDAAVMDTDKLVFVPEYRVFCEENACGNYDKNPACPPESFMVCFSITVAIMDPSIQPVALDIPGFPATVFSPVNVFSFSAHCFSSC